jgi:ribonuclease Z
MKVTILGNNSALQAFGRHPTAQAVTVYGEVFLLDCGEGTQTQMQRFGIKWRQMHHIFISHLHGDHYFGLPGLINSMSLQNRTAPLHLYAPAQLEQIIHLILNVANTVLSFPFHFHPLPEGTAILVDEFSFSVTCFPVEHRIPCHGFLIEQKRSKRKIVSEKCKEYNIPTDLFLHLRQGHDVTTPDNVLVKNEWVTVEGHAPKKYAYCADTLYTKSFLPTIKGADTIYHECTYLENEKDKARTRFHSTAREAATIAQLAGAKVLLLGHFSAKYKEVDCFLEEAKTVFPNAALSVEGETYDI